MTSSNLKSSQGMTLIDDQGKTCVDLVAGLASSLGHRHANIVAAIKRSCEANLGTVLDRLDFDWHLALGDALAEFEHCHLNASANEANEFAFRVARSAFGEDRYRVITLLGSDHGDTFSLRSASGRIQGQGFDGPVAVGYRHVKPADITALTKAIDPMTAAICIAPVDWNQGGEAFDIEYLKAVESLCRERDLLFMIDETRVPPGVGGTLFFHGRAEVSADIVTAASGWCGGLPGGMTFIHSRALASLQAREGLSLDWLQHQADLPLLREVVFATASTIQSDHLLGGIDEAVDIWAATLDELTSGFDFVRGCVHAGLWTTIELDLPAADVATRAFADGLRLLVTGETTLLICPPITATGDSLLEAIEPLRRAFESLERETTTS